MAVITRYWGLDGLILFISLMICAYLYVTRTFRYWKKRGIFEIQPTPFFGNFGECFFLKKTGGDFVKELYDAAKGLPYMGFYIFNRPSFLVRDPELIKHILVKDFNYFADRHATADTKDRISYTTLFIMKNPGWRTLRKKLLPIYGNNKMKKMFDLMIQVGGELDDYLESLDLNGGGRDLEIKDLAARFTTDLVGITAFGINVDSVHNKDADFRKYGGKTFEYTFRRGFEFLAIFFVPSLIKKIRATLFHKDTMKFFRYIFWKTAEQRIASGQQRNDLVDFLLELKKAHEGQDLGGFKFDGDDLVAQAANFYIAGFETSSTTIAFTLYELALQPDIQNRLRKEINDALEGTDGKITYELIMALPYLDMVVSETLRKYPPLPFLDRIVTADYKVPNSNVVLEKGTPVLIPMLGLHKDPEYFPEPEKYDPERFNDENKKNRPNYVYFPFGEGPHICIGKRIGLSYVKLGLVQILKKFEISPCSKTLIPMRFDPKGVTMTADGGLYLNMRKIVI